LVAHYKDCARKQLSRCWCEVRRYVGILAIGIFIFMLEIVGARLSGSLALLSDAGHVATDQVASITAIFVAVRIFFKGEEGITRFVGVVIHAVLLLGIAAWIIIEAIERLEIGSHIRSDIMMVVAFLGLLGNWWQYRLSGEAHNATHKGLNLHILSDFAYSVAVMLCGVLIAITGLVIIDTIVSFLLAISIAFSGLWLINLGNNHNHFH
jgi:cobalt-zinc-cadmium efflux system protein